MWDVVPRAAVGAHPYLLTLQKWVHLKVCRPVVLEERRVDLFYPREVLENEEEVRHDHCETEEDELENLFARPFQQLS